MSTRMSEYDLIMSVRQGQSKRAHGPWIAHLRIFYKERMYININHFSNT